MTYPLVGFGFPDAPLPFDGATFVLWLVLSVLVVAALLALALRLAMARDDRDLAVVADDDVLRVDFRMAA